MLTLRPISEDQLTPPKCSCALCRIRDLFAFYDDRAAAPIKRTRLTAEEKRERQRMYDSAHKPRRRERDQNRKWGMA